MRNASKVASKCLTRILTKFYSSFTEHDFSIYPASNIAAAAIAASLSGLNWHVRSHISIYDLVDKLAELSESESVSTSLKIHCAYSSMT